MKQKYYQYQGSISGYSSNEQKFFILGELSLNNVILPESVSQSLTKKRINIIKYIKKTYDTQISTVHGDHTSKGSVKGPVIPEEHGLCIVRDEQVVVGVGKGHMGFV